MRMWPWVAFASCLLALLITNHLSKTEHNPPVGAYIAVMGLVAACVTFRKEPSRTEKALWIGVMTILMVAEIRNLYVADNEQLKKFSTIKDGLTLANQGLVKTKEGLDGTLKALDTLLGETTGRDSYIYFTVDSIGPSPTPTQISIDAALVSPRFKGIYPLHDVHAFMIGPTRPVGEIQDLPTRPDQMGKLIQSMYIPLRSDFSRQRISVSMSGSSGNYFQVIMFLKIGDKWVWEARVYKGAAVIGKPLRQWSSPDFPKDRVGDWKKEDG
jgi:hypothetical protein